MDDSKAKLSQFIFMELFFDDVADLVLSSEITNRLIFGFEEKIFCQTQHFINLIISAAC